MGRDYPGKRIVTLHGVTLKQRVRGRTEFKAVWIKERCKDVGAALTLACQWMTAPDPALWPCMITDTACDPHIITEPSLHRLISVIRNPDALTTPTLAPLTWKPLGSRWTGNAKRRKRNPHVDPSARLA